MSDISNIGPFQGLSAADLDRIGVNCARLGAFSRCADKPIGSYVSIRWITGDVVGMSRALLSTMVESKIAGGREDGPIEPGVIRLQEGLVLDALCEAGAPESIRDIPAVLLAADVCAQCPRARP